MTLLCLDVNNSETTVGLFEADELIAHWQLSSDQRRTADEWQVLLDTLVTSQTDAVIEAISACCTVPVIGAELREMIGRYHGGAATSIVGPGVRTGLRIHTDNPREIGADRVVNALAAVELYGGPAIVVDLNGTATIFDVVDADDRYIGGAIAPGVEVSLDALARGGAQLRSIEVVEPRSAIGKNTVEALQSGAVFGFAGLIDGVVERLIDSLGADPEHVTVIATGTFPEAVIEHCDSVTTRDPWLTLTGLRLIHEMNYADR